MLIFWRKEELSLNEDWNCAEKVLTVYMPNQIEIYLHVSAVSSKSIYVKRYFLDVNFLTV